MADVVAIPVREVPSEDAFAKLVDDISADHARRGELVDLLREDHPMYNQRGATAISRMRGWVLLAFGRIGVSDRELPFVLEEFEVITDAYLVAAAARALRTYTRPGPALTPFLTHALSNVRDEPVSFESYGEYATRSSGRSPVRELLAALRWLGVHAQSALPALASLAQSGTFSKKLLPELHETIAAIRASELSDDPQSAVCCNLPTFLSQRWWKSDQRTSIEHTDEIVFEDQDGLSVPFPQYFDGAPSIVVFFYTRCDNPWKCSLTVTKLARLQQMLRDNGLSEQIRTAAITYDPQFDLPVRMRDYGRERGLRFDAHHRMLRATDGFAALRNRFRLGVNFVESLVNRHRIEVFVLDREGRIAASFERLHWKESEVCERAQRLLQENPPDRSEGGERFAWMGRAGLSIPGVPAAFALIFLPKCPICWAAYVSLFGTAGVMRRMSPLALQPMFIGMMLVNVLSAGLRARATGQRAGFYMVCSGTLLICLACMQAGWESVALIGLAITFLGTLWSVFGNRSTQYLRRERWSLRET